MIGSRRYAGAGRDALPRVRRRVSGSRCSPFLLVHVLWTRDAGRAGAHPYHVTAA